ncbi:MAG: helix-turn-helix domain-containing protein [Burkholderiales bacterium]|nr:helix-turn-helix domain-containing protein [Burkholderiales bacterium]
MLKPTTPLGGRIKLHMTAVGITNAATLARRASVSHTTVNRWLYERVDSPDAATLFRLSDILNVSARWLLSGEGSPTKPRQLTPNEEMVLDTKRTRVGDIGKALLADGDAEGAAS